MLFGKNESLFGFKDGARLHHLLPYESYDPGTQFFYNKGSTGFVLTGNPIAGVSLDDQGQAAQFFRQSECLPEGSSLQFLLFASPYVDPFLEFWIDPRKGKALEGISKRRAAFLQQKALKDSADLVVRDYRLMISYTVPGIKDHPECLKSLKRTRKELQGMLETLGIQTTILDAPHLLHELSHILNRQNQTGFQPTSWSEHDSLARQILDHDMVITIHEDSIHFTKSNKIVKSYIPKTFPLYWGLGCMDKFFGDLLNPSHKIACPFLMHYGLFVEQGQSKAKGKSLAKRETLENASRGNMGKWIPNLEDQMIESAQVCEQFQLGERLVTTGLSFTLFCDPDKVDAVEQSLGKIWRDGGWEFQSAKFDHLSVLLGSLPMTWTLGEKKGLFSKKVYGFGKALLDMGKAKKTLTREVQNMLPIVAEWKGQASPGIPLIGRRGQLFFWNPFGTAFLPHSKNAQTNHNYNVCIAGQTGSGKSVFMNEMVSNVIGVGGRVFVLDFGRSFKKTCGLFGGDHIEFDMGLDISLNPFSEITEGIGLEEVKDRDEMLSTIKPIIQVMASPKSGTNDLQNAFIDQAIHYAWEKQKSNASIDTIVEFLVNHKKSEAQILGETLFTFSSKGSYGLFFNRPSTINFNNKLVVIETDDLRNHPHLMAVVVQLLILHINQLMAKGDRVTPFLIVIDEAWKLLSGKDSAAFISEATRTARKYKGSIVLATQHLTDYFKPESPAATEAFNCSAWKCILYQEADVIKSFSKHDHLSYFTNTEFKEELMGSIHSNPPHYSEVMIYGPEVNGAVGRLCLDPYTRLLYSTNPEEYQTIENLIKSGASIDEAVEIVASTQNFSENDLHAD
jgi:conjugal transfer ATP-binding protein TraC